MPITISDYSFEGPYSSTSSLENRAGVYAILCHRNDSYYLIDVGESSEVRDRVEDHDREDCWDDNCTLGSIQYAALYTPNLQSAGRREIEQEIRNEYNVPCGEE